MKGLEPKEVLAPLGEVLLVVGAIGFLVAGPSDWSVLLVTIGSLLPLLTNNENSLLVMFGCWVIESLTTRQRSKPQ